MKRLLLAIGLLASVPAFSQRKQVEPSRYEYMPMINEKMIKGKITNKYVTSRYANPAYFVVVKKKHIYIVHENLFNALYIGSKHEFKGIVPVRWTPDRTIVPVQQPAPVILTR
ncbi:MAG: hypothetical protein EOO85_03995 [Pedobacter sp.]|nr:MAG: hypothetical protein EOO85_03995 [Pedobacter sp.]